MLYHLSMGLGRLLLFIYALVIIVDSIVSYFPELANSQFFKFNRKLADFSLKPVRKMLSPDLPVDFSPVVVLILLYAIKELW